MYDLCPEKDKQFIVATMYDLCPEKHKQFIVATMYDLCLINCAVMSGVRGGIALVRWAEPRRGAISAHRVHRARRAEQARLRRASGG
jgi:hypothetical protein